MSSDLDFIEKFLNPKINLTASRRKFKIVLELKSAKACELGTSACVKEDWRQNVSLYHVLGASGFSTYSLRLYLSLAA